jgi:hypothetical protein
MSGISAIISCVALISIVISTYVMTNQLSNVKHDYNTKLKDVVDQINDAQHYEYEYDIKQQQMINNLNTNLSNLQVSQEAEKTVVNTNLLNTHDAYINNIKISNAWSGYPDKNSNQAEISNDTHDFKQLMIVGNKSAGGPRKVGVWDQLDVNGLLNVNGQTQLNGDLTAPTVGRPANSTDWFRINGNNGNNPKQPGTALYNGLAINDGGGLDVGQWNKQPQGQLHADYIRSRGDIQTDKNLNLFAGRASIGKAGGDSWWNGITKKDDMVITNVNTDLKGSNKPDNGITLGPWNGQGGLRVHGGGVDVNGALKLRYPTKGDWTDQAAIAAWTPDGNQAGPSFGGPDNWSHFPWFDGNTYIRPGKNYGNIMIGDSGAANVYLGGNGGRTNFIGDSALNDTMMHIRGIGDPNHGLQYTGAVDGPRLFGCQGGQLGTHCGGDVTALSWDSKGNVNIPGKLCIGPPNNQWCFTPNGNGAWLDIQRNGATDGANQGSFHLTQDGNLYLNRSTYPGWVADNLMNVNNRIH